MNRRNHFLAGTAVILVSYCVFLAVVCLWLRVRGDELAVMALLLAVLFAVPLLVWFLLPLYSGWIERTPFLIRQTLRYTRWNVAALVSLLVALILAGLWIEGKCFTHRVEFPRPSGKFLDVSSERDAMRVEAGLDPRRVGRGFVLHTSPRSRRRLVNPVRPPWAPITKVRLSCPYWVLTSVFGALPALAVYRGYKRFRREAGHRCLHCGYDLTGNVSGVCPECGCATEGLGEEDCSPGP